MKTNETATGTHPDRDNATKRTAEWAIVTGHLQDACRMLQNAGRTCRKSTDTELKRITLPQIEKHLRDLTAMSDQSTFEIRITPMVSDKLEDQLCATLFKNAEDWILHHLSQLEPYDPTPSVSKRSHGTTTDPTVLKVMFNHNFTKEETAELASEITETVTESVTTRESGTHHDITLTIR